MFTPPPPPTASLTQTAPPSFARALLHRWLVEYNPIYLCSAALVLVGLTLIAHAVARTDAEWAALAAPALAELYALALIAGAAFLVRTGHRRPAAMLGLLAALYQSDLMMSTELSAYLDVVGKLSAVAWVLLFALKLRALAWALELRLSRSAFVIPVAAAFGIAALPQLLAALGPGARAELVALWLFGVGAGTVWTRREVESAVVWDVRGRRCIRAVWAMWAVMTMAHVGYWAATAHFELGVVLVIAPLLATRWLRREAYVWCAVGGTLAAVVIAAPSLLWVSALMAAATLLNAKK